ncbi:porin [Marinomonas sp. M1K-6]|uniref:Porin n=1 Tax=Marinomonas profundi TaxID=2726122 RepID=A0A847R028_9GAMM|nr:porin [Marinomonas profundi]NLQ19149.1 porin [Marinomonas profundi]UDV02044.1 porin [Marinomonas profundi]
MKKSIIAMAVSSAALASVSAYAAEGSTVDVYGNIQYAYADKEAGGNFEDNGSTVGLKGDTKINDDLSAFFKYEVEFEADQKKDGPDSGKANLDQAFVGLKGSFGKVQVGSFDNIYNNAIQDAVDQYEYLGVTNADRTSEGDTIAYFSPSINGFEVQAAVQVKGDASEGQATNANYDKSSSMMVVKYSTGIVSAALGYDTRANTVDAEETTGLAVTVMPLDNLSVTAKYETTKDTQDVLGLAARYGYGVGDVYASYQNVDPDAAGSDSFNEYAAGITYSLASNIYVFAELGEFENAKSSTTDTQTAVGVYYGF